jgi:hypothetical protein
MAFQHQMYTCSNTKITPQKGITSMPMINVDHFALIIFGDYGVLTNTPFKDNAPLAMLPGRVEYLAWVQEDRRQRCGSELHYAVAGNKGGAAWNKHTEEEGAEELRWTAEQIGSTHYAVCFGCPTCAPGFERYTTPEMLARRKPEPAMFRELAEQIGVPFERVLVVDHYTDAFRATKALGMTWQAPAAFFRDAESYITTATAAPEPDPMADLDLFDIDAALLAMEEE